VLAREGGSFLGAIYGEEEKAQRLALRGHALREHRQRFIRPIVRDFERWLDAVKHTLLPSEPLTAAINYYLNHGTALFRFVDDPLVPIDNSPTEREFQNVAKLRLNMLFAGSTEGAHRACVLLGIIATCRALRVPAQAYLAWAFERLGTHRDVFRPPPRRADPRGVQENLRITALSTTSHVPHPGVADRSRRRIGWHALRHSFASHLMMRGAPIRGVQELLGHATIEMTMRYAHMSPNVTRELVGLLMALGP
jgi:hypothetical protein